MEDCGHYVLEDGGERAIGPVVEFLVEEDLKGVDFAFCNFPEVRSTEPIMSTVLQLLTEGERLDTAQMATILDLSEAEVAAELKRLEAEHVLLGWRSCAQSGAG